jgi:hypothetical protein
MIYYKTIVDLVREKTLWPNYLPDAAEQLLRIGGFKRSVQHHVLSADNSNRSNAFAGVLQSAPGSAFKGNRQGANLLGAVPARSATFGKYGCSSPSVFSLV